ncbi:outer membrane beta-barrel family protein [Parabacteroides distasonis]|uniref:outer membrane beta-barrel family protein n=1 Tax=Parabacteroides distasonis TaxID=823 RepID=UPI0022E8221D|nr:outer membrane beta-barrel family protein [Parabacteroides distasonis]
MKRTIYYMILCLLMSLGEIMAQGISGKVMDGKEQPVDGVAVILQTLDSVYVDAVVTDTLGDFRLNHPLDQSYRLIFQHILYNMVEKEITTANVGTVVLEEKDYQLAEITVKGERPQVKLEGGKLTYDVPQLMKDKTATNAFEIIKDLPGLIERNDNLELVGASRLNIILNGQLTTMSADQLIQLLKTMPASRGEKAEVMYNAPAKYNVKGALLNVVLSKNESETPSWQGETGVDYTQYRHAGGDAHVNLLYTNKGFSIDFLLNGNKRRDVMGEDMLARHTLNSGMTEISQHNRALVHVNRGTVRLGMDYTFANEDKLSLAYYLKGDKVLSDRDAFTSYLDLSKPENKSESTSLVRDDGHSAIHNIRLQYDGHAGISAGADFTRYHSPSVLDYQDTNGSRTDMINNTRQDVSRWSVFLNKTHSFASGWGLNYGVHGGYASSKNYSEYLYDQGAGYEMDEEALEDNTQKEYIVDIFAEVSKSFGERFSATVGLKGEYFKSDYASSRENMNLWNEGALFPTVSLSYTFSPRHILQFDISSDKTYPGYWQVSPQVTPLNSYSEVAGNPLLKPYRTYEGQMVYIFRQKYMLVAFCEYTPDYFAQLPYQSDTELKTVFRFENMDYSLEAGLAVIIPFNVGRFWNSRITLRGWRMQEKNDNFHGISYNREAYLGLAHMSNTFNLCDKPNLKMTIDGQYVTPGAIQGIYDLGSMYEISAGLKWTFLNDRASLTLKGDDIFASSIPRTIKINQGNQWSRMRKLNDERCLKLSFVWKFGGYKEREHDSIDTSRFGK